MRGKKRKDGHSLKTSGGIQASILVEKDLLVRERKIRFSISYPVLFAGSEFIEKMRIEDHYEKSCTRMNVFRNGMNSFQNGMNSFRTGMKSFRIDTGIWGRE